MENPCQGIGRYCGQYSVFALDRAQQNSVGFILLIVIKLYCSLQIVEKLVDIVAYIHQAISEAFGDNGMSNI